MRLLIRVALIALLGACGFGLSTGLAAARRPSIGLHSRVTSHLIHRRPHRPRPATRQSTASPAGATPGTSTTPSATATAPSICAPSSSTSGTAAPQTAPTAATAAAATNALGLKLLPLLDADQNVVFSPYSIQTALAMLDQGASGASAQQLDALLGDADSPATLAGANQQLSGALQTAVSGYGSGGPTLNLANAVWLQTGDTALPAFSNTISADFGSAVQDADFAGDPIGSAQTINGWAAQQTDGMIPQVVDPSDLSGAEAVLANATYLNARWQDPFSAGATASANFTTPSGTESVPFMNSSWADTLPYASDAGCTVVGLPYVNSSLQMLAVMPPAGSLDSLQQSLTPTTLSQIAGSLKSTSVDVEMPKFTLSFSDTLNSELQQLGVNDIFGGDGVNLAGIDGNPLAISKVAHAARLQVDEAGTTAAAVTTIIAVATMALNGPPPPNVDLNHPFLIFLRDTNTGAILFAGRVEDPAASS